MNEMDEATLLKLAEAEILGEAKRAVVRHSIAGPSGWKPVPKTNKSFLVNTLLQTLSSNRILSRKQGSLKDSRKSERKLLQIDRRQLTNNNFIFKKSNGSKAAKEPNKLSNKSKKKKKMSRESDVKNMKKKKKKAKK